MAIVGVIPAAGYPTRLQPLAGSKEVLPVRGRPVMDYLVERMRAGGSTRLRVATRAEKEDVIAHARSLDADAVWEPGTCFQPLVRAIGEGADMALGTFKVDLPHARRSDVVVLGERDSIDRIEIKPAEPPSEWIWGCAAARAETGAASPERSGRATSSNAYVVRVVGSVASSSRTSRSASGRETRWSALSPTPAELVMCFQSRPARVCKRETATESRRVLWVRKYAM